MLAAKHELIDTALVPFAVAKDPVKVLTLHNVLDWVVVEEEDDDDVEWDFSGVRCVVTLVYSIRCVVKLVYSVVSVVLVV